MDEGQQIRARHESLGLYVLQILSAALGPLQTRVGEGEGKMNIIFLCVSISFSAFTASVVLPLRYTNILCRISSFFLVLSCSFLLSPFVPHVLFWFPYLACVFPLLHLLQLMPATLQASLQRLCHSSWTAIATLQASLQQLCHSSWTAICHFACGAYERLIRARGKPTPKDDSKLPTITTSSPPPCGGLEEGCVLKGKCSWEQDSFKRSREQFVFCSTLCSTGSIIIYAVTCSLVESNLVWRNGGDQVWDFIPCLDFVYLP